MNTEPDPLSKKCWAELHQLDFLSRSGDTNSNDVSIIISRYLKEARGTHGKEWQQECAKLKARNEQQMRDINRLVTGKNGTCFYCGKPTSSLAGDPGQWPLHFSLEDGIVRVFHTQCVTDRLFGAEHIRECAEKAAQRIKGPTFSALKDPEEIIAEHQTLVNIICEAFGAPVNDECEEALQTEWRRMELAGEAQRSVFNEFRNGFHAAWKLAKGKP